MLVEYPWKKCRRICLFLVETASPILFAATMGTGAISNLFSVFPYGRQSLPLLAFSLVFFFLNIVVFCVSTILMALKFVYYPVKRNRLFLNPVTSLYIGCFPMGATTIISVASEVVYQHFGFGGKVFVYLIWATWWINIVLAFLCAWVGIHVMATRQQHTLERMTTAWLLPVVTLIVSSSCGGVVSKSVRNFSAYHALVTITISIFMVTMGLTLAFMILTIYLHRLIVHGPPRGPSALSAFLPLGPTGQAGFAILQIGSTYRSLVPVHNAGPFLQSPLNAQVIDTVCTMVAFLLWCLATMWLVYAVLVIGTTLREQKVPFRSSFWGLVFPNGVYANLTIQLAEVFGSGSFRIFGAIYSVVVLILWMSIAVKSVSLVKKAFNAW